MTISELITQLESFEREYGDLPVVTTVSEEWYGVGESHSYRTDNIGIVLDEHPAEKGPGVGDHPENDLPDGPYLRIDWNEL